MTKKNPRFSISNEGRYVTFHFPRHEALLHDSKISTLFDEGSSVSVFVGDAAESRKNWTIRGRFTSYDEIEFTLLDSKEHKEVTVTISKVEFITKLLANKKEFILSGSTSYKVWE